MGSVQFKFCDYNSLDVHFGFLNSRLVCGLCS